MSSVLILSVEESAGGILADALGTTLNKEGWEAASMPLSRASVEFCNCFVLCWSEEAKLSDRLTKSLQEAQKKGAKVVLWLIGNSTHPKGSFDLVLRSSGDERPSPNTKELDGVKTVTTLNLVAQQINDLFAGKEGVAMAR